ncbi:hypothetical protein EWI00_13395 [Enterococcus faecium]|nr:hypothetical protein EWI00_13395 [Enterococcus faecium]RYK48149.1 hypothetical protein EWI03_11915 [Enterococcus faecium]
MFWKIKKMLVSSTNIKKYRADVVCPVSFFLFYTLCSLPGIHSCYMPCSESRCDIKAASITIDIQ